MLLVRGSKVKLNILELSEFPLMNFGLVPFIIL
jgi:hypothetical protein